MAREFTQEEIKAITESEAGLRDAGFDVDHEHATQNANLIMDYFQTNPSIPVTVASIYAFINANKDRFVWRTPAQREYDQIARENHATAAQLANWLATQGKPGQLVNTGDEAFVNSSLLLIELRGREVNSQRIYEAMGRISYRAGRQLHTIPMPRTVDPRSHVAHDDGSGFLGRDVNLTDAQHRAKARAAYAEHKESVETIRGREQAAAKHEAETMRGRTHSEDGQLQKLFVMDKYKPTEIDWLATRYARKQMQAAFERRAAVSNRSIR